MLILFRSRLRALTLAAVSLALPLAFAAGLGSSSAQEVPSAELSPVGVHTVTSVATEASGGIDDGVPASALSLSHALDPDLQNRMLLVAVTTENRADVAVQCAASAVTYGGVPLTRADGASIDNFNSTRRDCASLWYLLDDDLAAAADTTVSVTWPVDVLHRAVGAITLSNVAQGAPVATAASVNRDSATILTPIAIPDRGVAIDMVMAGDAAAEPMPDAGQEALIVTRTATSSMGVSIAANPANSIVGWSQTGANRLLHVVVVLNGVEPVAVPETRAVALVEGWNLVGWTGATPVLEATADIRDSLLTAFTWDTTGQAFRSFSPTAPDFINTLDELTLGNGVWANLSQAATWLQPRFAEARDVPLAVGFNLVMWTGPDTPVADAVAGIAGNLDGLFLWDALVQQFLIYRPTAPDFLNSAETLRYGDGVWLRMTNVATWSQSALAGPLPLPPEEEPAPFALTSAAFAANALIPAVYTCDGANTSPPLALTGLPADTVTLALIMDDPDAPGGTWVHWVAFNIAPTPLIEANIAALGTSGINSFGLTGYGGPCPPDGTHRYFFTVYALDAELALAPGASKAGLLAALDGHVLATAELVGLFR